MRHARRLPDVDKARETLGKQGQLAQKTLAELAERNNSTKSMLAQMQASLNAVYSDITESIAANTRVQTVVRDDAVRGYLTVRCVGGFFMENLRHVYNTH